MLLKQVDAFREREDGGVACEDDGDRCDEDEHGLDVSKYRFCERSAREEGHAEVDEDKVLGELRQSGEDIFSRALCPSRHSVVCVMLEGNAAEK